MIWFITVLRAFAACLIMNSHYEGIYPTDIIANGGLLGNIIFLAVSGYCLANLKTETSLKGFLKWYGKRLRRIYVPMTIATMVFVIVGYYKITKTQNLVYWFVFPTCHAFISAILVLYIPFYFIMKTTILKDHLGFVILSVFAIGFLVYSFLYDCSYYHIDAVHEPFILFLYMESMLIGAWFRENNEKYLNSHRIAFIYVTIILTGLYFVSKMSFSRGYIQPMFQIINQFLLFSTLFMVFITTMGFDEQLIKLPKFVKVIISFVANITLELYIVQVCLITLIRESSLSFPLNWLILTVLIILSAYVLHMISKLVNKAIDYMISAFKRQQNRS